MSIFGGSDIELPDPDKKILTDDEEQVLEKLAKKTVQRGMAVPAIIFLESIKPLNFVMSQVLVFFEPIIQSVFNFKDYDNFRSALEKRETVELVLLKIEKYDAISLEREKRVKKFMKVEKKKWKWYQRYLGLFVPKVELPDEVIHGKKKDDKGDGEKPSTDKN